MAVAPSVPVCRVQDLVTVSCACFRHTLHLSDVHLHRCHAGSCPQSTRKAAAFLAADRMWFEAGEAQALLTDMHMWGCHCLPLMPVPSSAFAEFAVAPRQHRAGARCFPLVAPPVLASVSRAPGILEQVTFVLATPWLGRCCASQASQGWQHFDVHVDTRCINGHSSSCTVPPPCTACHVCHVLNMSGALIVP